MMCNRFYLENYNMHTSKGLKRTSFQGATMIENTKLAIKILD